MLTATSPPKTNGDVAARHARTFMVVAHVDKFIVADLFIDHLKRMFFLIAEHDLGFWAFRIRVRQINRPEITGREFVLKDFSKGSGTSFPCLFPIWLTPLFSKNERKRHARKIRKGGLPDCSDRPGNDKIMAPQIPSVIDPRQNPIRLLRVTGEPGQRECSPQEFREQQKSFPRVSQIGSAPA